MKEVTGCYIKDTDQSAGAGFSAWAPKGLGWMMTTGVITTVAGIIVLVGWPADRGPAQFRLGRD